MFPQLLAIALTITSAALPNIISTVDTTIPCSRPTPIQPQPPDGSEVPQGLITLTWATDCDLSLASSYEVRINDKLVATPSAATYTFKPDLSPIHWQIVAITSDGTRVESPIWSFSLTTTGWLATPAAPPQTLITEQTTALWQPLLVFMAASVLLLVGGVIRLVGRRDSPR